jgi:hypothetical protein
MLDFEDEGNLVELLEVLWNESYDIIYKDSL